MSSWKNASKAGQKTHRERHQPRSREHLGLLEKKKDYQQRAKDFGDKKATLKLLRKRALNRNPDEFYFHMINSKVMEGVHHEVDKEMDDEDTKQQEKLMNTQDFRYVTMKRTAETKKLSKLQTELHLLDVANQTSNKHTFFVDTKKEAHAFNVAERLGTHPDLVARRINRPKLEALKTMSFSEDEKICASAKQEKIKKYKELAKRVEREHELRVVEEKLHMKRQLLKKNHGKPVKKSAGSKDAAPVYKWEYERKR